MENQKSDLGQHKSTGTAGLANKYQGQIDLILQLREAIPEIAVELPPQRQIKAAREAGDEEWLEQVKKKKALLLSGRVGSLMVPSVDLDNPSHHRVPCTCLCGETVVLRLSALRAAAAGREDGSPRFYPPVGNEKQETIVKPCRHLYQQARKDHQYLYFAWVRIRREASARAASQETYILKEEWFDLETGFLAFLVDFVDQYEEGKNMRRRSDAPEGHYLPQNYFLSVPPTSRKGTEDEAKERRLIANRYYAVRSEARKNNLPLRWEDASEFLRVIGGYLSENYPDESISGFRLSWDKPKVNGFGPDNWELIRKERPRHSRRHKKQTMNFAGREVPVKKYLEMRDLLTVLLVDPEVQMNVEQAVKAVLEAFEGDFQQQLEEEEA
jgi:hypothetical protein